MKRELIDSNIEWLGKIPTNWIVQPLKRVINERNELNKSEKETFLLSLTIQDGIIPYSEKNGGGNKAKEDISKYKIVKKNDLVINSMNVVVGASGISKYDGLVSPVYYVFSETSKSCGRFYNYLFLNQTFENHLFGLGNGILVKINEDNGKMNTIRKKIPIDKLRNEFVPVPPLEEQIKISNYLDNKVSLINKTIENNKKEIELLDEYKKNIFSGVIKEYNFKNYKLKYLTNKKLQYGANSSGVVYRDDLPRYVRITDILNNTLKEQDKLSLQEDEAKDFILKDGDILFARSGGTVGKSFMYENKFGRCAFAGYLIRASFNNKELAQYVYNFTNSVLYEKWKNSIFIQSTIQNIGADKYSNMLIPIPIDFDNVVRVNNKINKIIIKLDKVIEYRNQIIEKLEEYKKSLIYEAVTGKIEV